MEIKHTWFVLVVMIVIVAAGSESPAVTYMYTNEKGEAIYVNDLNKVPPKERERAMIVSTQDTQVLQDDAERLKALSSQQGQNEQERTAPVRESAPKTNRLRKTVDYTKDAIRTVGEKVVTPITGIRKKQAERGRKAAEAYKVMDRALQQKAEDEMERIQKQFDEAEQGK